MMQVKNKVRHQRGIALLLTLLVLVLITTFMSEFFFETSLEIRTIQNFRSSFVAQSVAKSMFRATVLWLVQDDSTLFETLRNLYQLTNGDEEISLLNPPTQLIAIPKEFLEDFGEATVYTPYVRPIDHLYNLNRLQSGTGIASHTPADKINFNEFVNLVIQIPVEIPQEEEADDEPQTMFLETQEITSLYAYIFDYIDTKDDNTPYSNPAGVTGSEDSIYLETENHLEIPPKNRKLDRLTEIRLINGIFESGIPYEDWKKHFTIYDVGVEQASGEIQPRLNINLATNAEVVFFLQRFYQIESPYYLDIGEDPSDVQAGLEEYAANAQDIADQLVFNDELNRRKEFTSFNEVKDLIENVDAITTNQHKKFFILHSQWFEIRLVAEANGIQSEIQAIVYIPKNENGDSTGNPIIKDFIIR